MTERRTWATIKRMPPMDANPSFGELFDLFVDLRKGYLRPSTVSGVYLPAKQSFIAVCGDRPASEYTPIEVLRFIQKLLETRKPSGVNITVRSLRCFGRWCASQQLLPRENVWANLKPMRIADGEIRYLTPEQFRKLYRIAGEGPKGHVHQKLLLFAVMSGMRLGDLVALDWSMVDLTQRVLRFRMRKVGRWQVVPLHPTLVELLEKWPHRAGNLWRPGKPYTAGYVSRRFLRMARKAGLPPGWSFHCLRRTFASWLVRDGVGIFEVSKLLGHSSPVLTSKLYASLSPGELHGTVSRLVVNTGSMALPESTGVPPTSPKR